MNLRELKYSKRDWLPKELCHEFLKRRYIKSLILWIHILFFFFKQGSIPFKCCLQSEQPCQSSCTWDAGRHGLPEAVVPFVLTGTMPCAHQQTLSMGGRLGRSSRRGEVAVTQSKCNLVIGFWGSHSGFPSPSIIFYISLFLHPSLPLSLLSLSFPPSFLLVLGTGM